MIDYRDSTAHNVTHEVRNLKPCSLHTLTILPIIAGSEFEPDTTEFRTAPPAPSPPTTFKAAYKQEINKVKLYVALLDAGVSLYPTISNSPSQPQHHTLRLI